MKAIAFNVNPEQKYWLALANQSKHNILFLVTIFFAIGYLFYYHIGGYGELQDQE